MNAGVSKPSSLYTSFGPVGACAYIAGFCLPFRWDVPLAVLAVFSILAALGSDRAARPQGSPLRIPVMLFVLATALTIVASHDVYRSLRLSAPLAPALLLFWIIEGHFRRTQHIRLLYATCSGVAVGLASLLLITASRMGWSRVHGHVAEAGSPLLIEANDAALLAVIAPMSLALFRDAPRSVMGIGAAISILLSVIAAVAVQSRTTMLALIVSVASAAILMRTRRRVLVSSGLALLGVVFLADWLPGFPLLKKLALGDGGRLSLWLTAWAMFLDAPLLGHGPHSFALLSSSFVAELGIERDLAVIPWIHNLYLEVLAERGLVGFVTFAGLLAASFGVASRVQRSARSDVRILNAAAVAALLSFCVAASVELTFLRKWVVIILLLVVGVIGRLSTLKCAGEHNTHQR